jgi:hypothetical protein
LEWTKPVICLSLNLLAGAEPGSKQCNWLFVFSIQVTKAGGSSGNRSFKPFLKALGSFCHLMKASTSEACFLFLLSKSGKDPSRKGCGFTATVFVCPKLKLAAMDSDNSYQIQPTYSQNCHVAATKLPRQPCNLSTRATSSIY